jgi:hypothetical protein
VAITQVKVLWVVNAVEKNWERELPKDVRDELNASRNRRGGLYATEEGKADATKEEEEAKGELNHMLRMWADMVLHAAWSGKAVRSSAQRDDSVHASAAAGTSAASTALSFASLRCPRLGSMLALADRLRMADTLWRVLCVTTPAGWGSAELKRYPYISTFVSKVTAKLAMGGCCMWA